MIDLGTLGGNPSSVPRAVNASGQVVGASFGAREPHGFSWTSTGGMVALRDLGRCDRFTASKVGASGISATGHIVGSDDCLVGVPARAILWANGPPARSGDFDGDLKAAQRLHDVKLANGDEPDFTFHP